MWKYPQKVKDIHRNLWISTGGKADITGIHRFTHRAVDKFIYKAVIYEKLVKKAVNTV